MRGMLVAAGFGTRLDPLTRELPKPALPVANRPVAWFACDQLARHGVRELVANTHHLAATLERELAAVCPPGLQLRFLHEPAILGTGGGVRNAWSATRTEPLIAFNAKLVFGPDLTRALAEHRACGALATLVLRPCPPDSAFAPVWADQQGRVHAIRAHEPPFAGLQRYMWTGVQVLEPRAFSDLPAQGDIFEHAYLPWLARGERIHGVIDHAPWIDVGVTPRHYLDANLAFARGELSWPGLPEPRDGVLAAPSAIIGDGARLDQVVLGAGAVVEPGAKLTRVVLWPGAHATTTLQDSILTTNGTIVRV
ncbi:MAG TPA: NDP-sugar synthase [Polyangiales bacterium]|nr:NDP-sugar synthase [Polyangiales bacterium]